MKTFVVAHRNVLNLAIVIMYVQELMGSAFPLALQFIFNRIYRHVLLCSLFENMIIRWCFFVSGKAPKRSSW